jgi:serpin B
VRRSSVSVLLAAVVAACGISTGAALAPDATPLLRTTSPKPAYVKDTPTITPSAEPTAVHSAEPSAAAASPSPAQPTIAPIDAPASATPNPHRAASSAIDALAADLYRQLVREHDDLVFSPYSAEVALAMARIGARGLTRSQMDAVLHAALVADLDAELGALERELARRPGQYPYWNTTIPLELASANRLWAQSDYEFQQRFIDVLSAQYGAGVGLVDYKRAAEAARKAINEWVSDRTRARIPELIPADILNERTRFVLTNAIYLKAKWARPFQSALTRAAPFHRLDGRDSEVRMMRAGTGTYGYRRGSDYQAVHLPYVGGLSMVVIVPDTGAFAAFESRLDGARLTQIAEDVAYTSIDLSMPRFEFRTTSFLKPPLSQLGMPIAFTESADFSGIATREPLYIQDVIQQAFISVDEEGTEAAAATAVIGGATGGPNEWITLTIDRPFLFLIRDDATGATLFMGRVLDPS